MSLKSLLRTFRDYVGVAIVSLSSPTGFSAPLEVPSNAEIVKNRLARAEKQLNEIKTKISEARAQIRRAEDQLSGAYGSDARLIIVENSLIPQDFEKQEETYLLDQKVVKSTFDDFIIEGPHELRIEKSYKHKGQVFRVEKTVNFVAVKGQTTTLEVTALENTHPKNGPVDTLLVDVKTHVVPNNKTGRSLIVAQELGNPADRAKQAPWLIVNVVNKVDLRYKLVRQELLLDKKALSIVDDPIATADGQIIFEGELSEGSHRVDAILTYEAKTGSSANIKNYQYKMRFHRSFVAKQGVIERLDLVGEKI